VELREASVDDVTTIHTFIGELADYERLRHEVEITVEDLRTHLFGHEPVARVTLAFVDGEPAGMALWWRTFSTFLGRPGIWLEDLFVRPAHRGRGLGAALLADLRARTDGRVEWSVLDWNEPAISFYERLGARPHAGWTTFRWLP